MHDMLTSLIWLTFHGWKMSSTILKPHAAIRLWHGWKWSSGSFLCILQVCSLCLLRDCCQVHLAVSQPAYWRRWIVWIKFHPYALELFSHVSPAELLVAFCCQRNYVTGFHSLSGPTERESALLIFFGFHLGTVVVNELRGKQQNRTGAAEDSL